MALTEQVTASRDRVKIVNYLPVIGKETIVNEIVGGLKAAPKRISPKYFYDEVGSKLFEEITRLSEYYPTRCEKQILTSLWDKLHLEFDELSIVELGSGDASKIRLLLRQIPEFRLEKITYIPIDISKAALNWAADELTREYPELNIHGIVADFLFDLSMIPENGQRLFCFLGGTIGNFDPDEARRFLEMLGAVMHSGDRLLLGMDMVKEFSIIESAYNDARQVTARFNKNILRVVNRLIGADFEPALFSHVAFYNREKNRIEMHLKARKDMTVHLGAVGESIQIARGEMIHTENSYKFTRKDIAAFAHWAGLETVRIFTDDKQWFNLAYFEKRR